MVPGVGTFAYKAVDFLTEITALSSHFLNEGVQPAGYHLAVSQILLSCEFGDILHLVSFTHDIDGLVMSR
jgi:hypothetical protein